MDSKSDEQITEDYEMDNEEQNDKVTVASNKMLNNKNNNSEDGKNDNTKQSSGTCHNSDEMSTDEDDDNCTNENVLTKETTISTLTCAEHRKKIWSKKFRGWIREKERRIPKTEGIKTKHEKIKRKKGK